MKIKQKKPLIILNEKNPSIFSEAFRTLRTNLSYASSTCPCRCIVVTSPGPHDGKSVVAANLAIVLAQAGNDVLLVDCDLRKSSQQYIFGLENSRGLVNVLLHNTSMGECITGIIPGLWVLPSGPIPPNPAEIISLNKTREFWKQQLNFFDFVIIDTPPILVVTDPVLLASQADGVLLVLDSTSTRIDLAQEVKDRLNKVQARIMGVVLNRVPVPKVSDYNQYYRN